MKKSTKLALGFLAAIVVGVLAQTAVASAQPTEAIDPNTGIDIAAVIALIAAVPIFGTVASKFYELVKRVTAMDWLGVIGILAVNGGGVLTLWLVSQSDLAGSVGSGAFNLETANFATIALLGIASGSTASVGYDVKRAIDNRDSSQQPMLGGGEPVVPPLATTTVPGSAIIETPL